MTVKEFTQIISNLFQDEISYYANKLNDKVIDSNEILDCGTIMVEFESGNKFKVTVERILS